ncbi:hypothetical protein [Photobacterium chitinilyticum]
MHEDKDGGNLWVGSYGR